LQGEGDTSGVLNTLEVTFRSNRYFSGAFDFSQPCERYRRGRFALGNLKSIADIAVELHGDF
jgi:hypothetical protein